jgi:Eukaryotic aspartyl protease
LFTANLKHGTAGGYEFGVVDTTLFSGSLTTVPVNSQNGFWEFTSTQVAIGNSQPQTVTGGSGTAIADTGTSLLIVDPSVVSAYWGQVSGAVNSAESGGVVFPCNSALPDLSLAIGDTYMATINGSLMNFAQAGADSQSGQACKFSVSPLPSP